MALVIVVTNFVFRQVGAIPSTRTTFGLLLFIYLFLSR